VWAIVAAEPAGSRCAAELVIVDADVREFRTLGYTLHDAQQFVIDAAVPVEKNQVGLAATAFRAGRVFTVLSAYSAFDSLVLSPFRALL
jgi:hypothetical protein